MVDQILNRFVKSNLTTLGYRLMAIFAPILYMSDSYKGKAKISLAWLSLLPFVILTYCSTGFTFPVNNIHNPLTGDTVPLRKSQVTDTLKPRPGFNARAKTVINRTDTIIRPSVDTFAFKTSKDSLNAPVVYHADDSMILDVPQKKLFLYGKVSSIKYEENELTAPHIEYDQRSNIVKAFIKKDSAGNVISYPNFVQGDFKSKSDTIEFNMRSGRGLTKGTYTQQGEMYVYGEKIKKASADIFYAQNARFTTCNLDTPHFAFISRKIKFITNKMAFSGPVHPEFEGVPLPIYLPFGIYPLTRGRHSGLIAPSFKRMINWALRLTDWDIIKYSARIGI